MKSYRFLFTLLLLYPFLILTLSAFRPGPVNSPFVEYQEPEFLTYEELQELSRNPEPNRKLKAKLERFWKTPIISNEAYIQGMMPAVKKNRRLGTFMRVASWNIEKSLNIPDAITVFTSPEKFKGLINTDIPVGSTDYEYILLQQKRLMTSDVVILQEMDIGVKRSGYRNATADLAKAMNMNYAYGPEQLEVDPVILSLESLKFEDDRLDEEATKYFRADPEKVKGVFGSAVLSKYPIKSAEVFQLETQTYDWYSGEIKKTTFLEKGRRTGSKTVFKNELTREVKVGGRIFFRVDLYVPELPNETLTVINVHLEIKCTPKGREMQMKEILSYIKDIKNPVILAGDFNSAPTDLSPTSVTRVVKRTAKNPTTWLSVGINYFTAEGATINTSRFLSNATKNFQNPLAKHIPIVAPNAVKGLFDRVEYFRFKDDGVFDFRGNGERSMNGKDKKLANSNERDLIGFKTTFRVRRPIGFIGKYRLDWIFVKSFLKDGNDDFGSYRFAPHFGETLEEMNTSLVRAVSDHHPNVVDLPFEEPGV